MINGNQFSIKKTKRASVAKVTKPGGLINNWDKSIEIPSSPITAPIKRVSDFLINHGGEDTDDYMARYSGFISSADEDSVDEFSLKEMVATAAIQRRACQQASNTSLTRSI